MYLCDPARLSPTPAPAAHLSLPVFPAVAICGAVLFGFVLLSSAAEPPAPSPPSPSQTPAPQSAGVTLQQAGVPCYLSANGYGAHTHPSRTPFHSPHSAQLLPAPQLTCVSMVRRWARSCASQLISSLCMYYIYTAGSCVSWLICIYITCMYGQEPHVLAHPPCCPTPDAPSVRCSPTTTAVTHSLHHSPLPQHCLPPQHCLQPRHCLIPSFRSALCRPRLSPAYTYMWSSV